MKKSVILALAVLLVTGAVAAQANDDDNVPILPIDTAFVYPNNPPKQIPAGQEVDLLITFSNQAHVHLNLTSVQGSVNSPLAFNSYVENLTAVEYDTLVAPGKEATLKYTFKPDSALVGRKFQLAHVLTYKTGQYVMHKTVYNSTVVFTEPMTSLFDSTTLLLLIQLLGIISVGGFYGMKELEKRGLLKLDKKEVKEVKTRKPEDWLPGSFMAAQDKSFDAPRSPKSPGKGKKRS